MRTHNFYQILVSLLLLCGLAGNAFAAENIVIVRDPLPGGATCLTCDIDGDGIVGEIPDDQYVTLLGLGGLSLADYPGMTSIISLRQLQTLLTTGSVTLEATNTITLNTVNNILGILNFNANTLNLIAPNVNLFSHLHGTGMLNVVASNQLYLGVNLHITELKPVLFSGVDGMNSTLSGGKDYVITGIDSGTVKLVNGMLEDAGNSNANIASWAHFANIQGISDADVPVLAVQCPPCSGISSVNSYFFQPSGSLSGGILGLEASDTVDYDGDGDGIGNNTDWDDDGDGIPDGIDANPLSAANSTELILPLDATRSGAVLNSAVQR